MPSSVASSAQILFSYEWKKREASTLLLLCIGKYGGLVQWNEIFFIFGSSFTLQFSCIELLQKCLPLDFKTDLTTNGLILGFFAGKYLVSLFSLLQRVEIAWNVQVRLSFEDIKTFWCSNMMHSLKDVHVLFSQRLLQFRLMSFILAIQLHILRFLRCPASFFSAKEKQLGLHLKSILVSFPKFSKFFFPVDVLLRSRH